MIAATRGKRWRKEQARKYKEHRRSHIYVSWCSWCLRDRGELTESALAALEAQATEEVRE